MREESEKRNQKRQEAEPVIPRTCGHRPLEAPRPPAADPRPLTVMASEFRTQRQQPLSQNPADTPGISMLSYLCPFSKRFIFLYEALSKHSLIQDGHQFNMAAN